MVIENLISQIEIHAQEIAKHRDALRDIEDTLKTYLDSFDRGIDCLDSAKIELGIAVDALSEHV